MRTILVPVRGGEADDSIFETALAAAKPLAAHVDFHHVKMGVGEAAASAPYVGFAMGAGLTHALDELQLDEQTRSVDARDRVAKFCRRHGVPLVEKPQARPGLSASWCEQAGEPMPLIMARARHSDLAVLGRPRRGDHLPEDLLERLLLESGRPILVAPPRGVRMLIGTIMVCWKECREAAHAVTAAMPLIRRADRVLIAGVSENGEYGAPPAVNELAAQMLWQGIDAEPRSIAADGRAVASVLAATAQDCGADLVVMGGYGHGRIREMIFGGCTDAFLRSADRAVLLVH